MRPLTNLHQLKAGLSAARTHIGWEMGYMASTWHLVGTYPIRTTATAQVRYRHTLLHVLRLKKKRKKVTRVTYRGLSRKKGSMWHILTKSCSRTWWGVTRWEASSSSMALSMSTNISRSASSTTLSAMLLWLSRVCSMEKLCQQWLWYLFLK